MPATPGQGREAQGTRQEASLEETPTSKCPSPCCLPDTHAAYLVKLEANPDLIATPLFHAFKKSQVGYLQRKRQLLLDAKKEYEKKLAEDTKAGRTKAVDQARIGLEAIEKRIAKVDAMLKAIKQSTTPGKSKAPQ